MDNALHHVNLWAFAFLFLWGLWLMIVHDNLVKKVVGMYFLQTSVMLFYLTNGVVTGATVPVLVRPGAPDTAAYMNPLPHTLMLTAIVVGVATLGVALGLVILIHRHHGTLEESEILAGR